MASNTRKFVVRDGFVLHLQFQRPSGDAYSRTHEAGEQIELTDEQHALHGHKVEFASDKDRAAALAAERAASVAARAAQDPAELIRQLTEALAQARGAGGPAGPTSAA